MMRTGHQMWWWEANLDQIVCDKGDDSQKGVDSRQEGSKEVETVSLDNSRVSSKELGSYLEGCELGAQKWDWSPREERCVDLGGMGHHESVRRGVSQAQWEGGHRGAASSHMLAGGLGGGEGGHFPLVSLGTAEMGLVERRWHEHGLVDSREGNS